VSSFVFLMSANRFLWISDSPCRLPRMSKLSRWCEYLRTPDRKHEEELQARRRKSEKVNKDEDEDEVESGGNCTRANACPRRVPCGGRRHALPARPSHDAWPARCPPR
jgi:hypothetical protein